MTAAVSPMHPAHADQLGRLRRGSCAYCGTRRRRTAAARGCATVYFVRRDDRLESKPSSDAPDRARWMRTRRTPRQLAARGRSTPACGIRPPMLRHAGAFLLRSTQLWRHGVHAGRGVLPRPACGGLHADGLLGSGTVCSALDSHLSTIGATSSFPALTSASMTTSVPTGTAGRSTRPARRPALQKSRTRSRCPRPDRARPSPRGDVAPIHGDRCHDPVAATRNRLSVLSKRSVARSGEAKAAALPEPTRKPRRTRRNEIFGGR
ncbi:hypothetical protein J2Y70_004109 [Xanthomonas translucens]|nr:hypothetical protein [Xanthomonas translucens]